VTENNGSTIIKQETMV